MKAKPLPPLEELKEFLDYNPDTGIITWKKARRGIRVGQVAGGSDLLGYFVILFNYKQYKAHRLDYYMYHGIDPLEKLVDHIDGDGTNNKIDNLRLATYSQNGMNRVSLSRRNTSGCTGVYWHKTKKKWQAQIKLKKGLKFLGAFINKEDAIQARIEAEKKYFGEFRRDSQIDCDFPK